MTDESHNAPPTLPSWIARENARQAEAAKQASQDAQQQFEDSVKVNQGSPAFWKVLVDQLKFQAGGLDKLVGEELVGNVSQLASGVEENCHIQVDRQSVSVGPALSRMDLYYQSGGMRIRRWYQGQDAGDIDLVRYGDEVRAVIVGHAPMTAYELAEHIVRSMAARVRGRRHA